ncbi:uncharacterized protein DDB_G0271670 isoform X1 [Sitodiplosis mosellana]|uniref:uncharacterized protein DDB_G0271670 isoform X1 n=1 Tax=Sitodiplosis mosellana TaxID=263140 RepID=UPI0024438AAA|nr:uncharacterized protein DDB_G0271670 isoform X1 [Sitodiplosis mosellana]
MKNLLIVATSALCVLLAVAVPLPEQDVQLVQIPLEGNKELDILSLPENSQGELTERNKRTIGVLRQLFPELSKKTEQVIEETVQLILPIILRNVGPLLLRGGLGGLSGGGGAATNNDDDDDDFDEDETEVANRSGGATSTRQGSGGRKVSISLPTFPPDTEDEEEEEEENNANDESNTIKTNEEVSTSVSSSSSSSSSSTSTSTETASQVSSQKPNETENPIQTVTKPTVTTTTTTTKTTTTVIETITFELDTTQPPPFSSTAPPLLRPSIETTTPLINDIETTTTTIPSSSVPSLHSDQDQATENLSDRSGGSSESVATTIHTPKINDGPLTFPESSTDSDNSVETTTGPDDFSGRIDIRSPDLESDTAQTDSANVETTTTTTISPANTSADSSNENIASTSTPNEATTFLPISQNLVRRRKSVVIKRRHIHNE